MTLKKTVSAFVVTLALFAFVGCAAIIHGSKQTVKFQSSPAGATVEVKDALRGIVWCMRNSVQHGSEAEKRI